MHIFTYGSLMFPQVWQRVVRGVYHTVPADLGDYARRAIDGVNYPAIVPQQGEKVVGVVYLDVTLQDVAALDAFEGDEYRRDTVRVTLAGGDEVDAGTYVYLLPHKLSGVPWQREEFHLDRFLGTYCEDKLDER
jgi:gamma-glutamylcyclotransferase (GGCT)/AIG2-like uncharacterized protein YtfP